MDQQQIKSESPKNGIKAKRVKLTQEMLEGMDHVYRSNPYPSKLEFEILCKDLLVSIGRAKNWFGTRRRHDLKEGKLCRHCRFFKAPVSEEAHNWYGSRPCVTYWKLPTVAPPPIVQTTSLPMTSLSSGDVSSTMDESIDEKPDHQTVRDKIDEDMPTYFNDGAAAAVAPTAFSLAFQPGTYNFQQPIFNFEPNDWYQQHHDGQFPVDMSAGNNWMMRPAGTGQTSFWPMPFHNYSQTPDLPPVDQLLSSDLLLSQVQPSLPNYSMPYPLYPQYPYSTDTFFNYNEQNGTSNN